MQAPAARSRKLAQAPFNDSDADFVLETSDKVTFRLLSHIMSRASPIFHDMLGVPHPSAADASPSDYVDGKPVVRVTEDSKIMDAFLRCCYPVPHSTLGIEQLVAVYTAGDKYAVEAVKRHVVNELSRYIPQTEHSLRAYLLACHFGLRDEMERAAKQTLEMRKDDLLHIWYPELDLIQASFFTRLLNFRQRCVDNFGGLFTPLHRLLRDIEDGKGRPPLWESYYYQTTPECSCAVSIGHMDGGEPLSDDEQDDENDDDGKYWVKKWYLQYMKEMEEAVHQDNMPI
ncbi:hypothetical protein NM688_g5779 [Phlebia brevispora]|uniref:Uncharacterized protein n=1 Tax=Phlebia brevispora TaxID=194682 RepID=A0ACC1SPR6_9APHY|nr:hypothetical protein NM688_g5779 [Phlebia brevispora]